MGALTNKPFMFTFRTWELQDVHLFDVFESSHIESLIQYDGLKIKRILPRLRLNYNIEWLSDYSRYYFDSLLKNRLINLIYCFSNYKIYLLITWSILINLFIFVLRLNYFEICFNIIFNNIWISNLLCILANWVDIMHMYNLKIFLLKTGFAFCSIIYNKINIVKENGLDFRFTYLYNVISFDNIVNIIKKKDSNVNDLLSKKNKLIVIFCFFYFFPRLEMPSFFLYLKNIVLKSFKGNSYQNKLIYLSFNSMLPRDKFNRKKKSIFKFSNFEFKNFFLGKSSANLVFKKAEVIFNFFGTFCGLHHIFQINKKVIKTFKTIFTFSTVVLKYPTNVGYCDFNLVFKKNVKTFINTNFSILFLLNLSKTLLDNNTYKNIFTIYEGVHGIKETPYKIDLFIPLNNFFEKDFIYHTCYGDFLRFFKLFGPSCIYINESIFYKVINLSFFLDMLKNVHSLKFTRIYRNKIYGNTKKQLFYLLGYKHFLFFNHKSLKKNIFYEQNIYILYNMLFNKCVFPFFNTSMNLLNCSSIINSKTIKSLLQNLKKTTYRSVALTI